MTATTKSKPRAILTTALNFAQAATWLEHELEALGIEIEGVTVRMTAEHFDALKQRADAELGDGGQIFMQPYTGEPDSLHLAGIKFQKS